MSESLTQLVLRKENEKEKLSLLHTPAACPRARQSRFPTHLSSLCWFFRCYWNLYPAVVPPLGTMVLFSFGHVARKCSVKNWAKGIEAVHGVSVHSSPSLLAFKVCFEFPFSPYSAGRRVNLWNLSDISGGIFTYSMMLIKSFCDLLILFYLISTVQLCHQILE